MRRTRRTRRPASTQESAVGPASDAWRRPHPLAAGTESDAYSRAIAARALKRETQKTGVSTNGPASVIRATKALTGPGGRSRPPSEASTLCGGCRLERSCRRRAALTQSRISVSSLREEACEASSSITTGRVRAGLTRGDARTVGLYAAACCGCVCV